MPHEADQPGTFETDPRSKESSKPKELWEQALDDVGLLHPRPSSPETKNDHPPTAAQADRIAGGTRPVKQPDTGVFGGGGGGFADEHLEDEARKHRPFTENPARPARADRSNKRSLELPAKLDLGTTTVGETSTHRIPVTDRTRGGLSINPRVTGIPALSVQHVPRSIFSNLEPYSPSVHDLRLGFSPRHQGPVSGTLDLGISDERYDNPKIPIVGSAHGEPPMLVPLPDSYDLGEQVVGSEHWFTIGATKLTHPSPLRGQVTHRIQQSEKLPDVPEQLRVDNSAAFATDASPGFFGPAYPSAAKEVPIRVRFAPTHPGPYRADLVVAVQWSNGAVMLQQVTLTAAARNLEDAPPQPVEPNPTERPPLGPFKKVPATWEQVGEFDTDAGEAADKAALLAGRQRDGLQSAQEELVGAKVDETPKPAFFSQLANLAILMAVGGVAQVVAKLIARNVVGAILQLDPEQVKSAQLVDGLGAAFKDGLKGAAKGAIDLSSDAGRVSGGGEESQDAVVNFFARQRMILTTLADQNRALITQERRRLLPVLGARPQLVKAVFQRLRDTFQEASESAADAQAVATVSKWVSGLAQEKLGTNMATRNNVGSRTTDLSSEPLRWHKHPQGLLELEVTLEDTVVDVTRLKVTSANMRGVANTAAGRLTTVPLLDMGIPVRITVRSPAGTASIRRDEAGRVHFAGTLPARSNPHENPNGERNAAAANLDATRICEFVLSRPLDAWGIEEITTDRTGHKAVGS